MSEYDTDLVVWSTQQAALLRRMAAGERVNDQVDWENVAEEIESLGRSDKREVESRVQTILVHLIKLLASPAKQPRAGWRSTVIRQRVDLTRLLKESPSLRLGLASVIEAEMPASRMIAVAELAEYGDQPQVDPSELSFSADQLLGPWLPD